MHYRPQVPLDVEILEMHRLSLSDYLRADGEVIVSHDLPLLSDNNVDEPLCTLCRSLPCPHCPGLDDPVALTHSADGFNEDLQTLNTTPILFTAETEEAPCGASHTHHLLGPTEACHDCVSLTTLQLAIMRSVRSFQGTAPYGAPPDIVLEHLVELTHTTSSELLSNMAWLLEQAYLFSPLDDGHLAATLPLVCTEHWIFNVLTQTYLRQPLKERTNWNVKKEPCMA
ncbi:uncharacterized protein F5147DRAFT_650772 [Suillus discolor]|uniref:Uncharacterized protein n=1 Tax=Suillus discolor TaxID=1912936 RepID=A0A9P7FB13_9AGAM|nr:uncharacterized protein F5147DRAFT_650772 [Suillus discolor]KAG2112601.1 hypothetical protein F5147DRAFT_650772 [Suillus discolor]